MEEQLKENQNENTTEIQSEKQPKKKHKLIKYILGLIGVLVAIIAVAAVVLLNNPKLQMKIFSNYVMHNLSHYNWSALQMEDPVMPTLLDSLGEEKTQSADEFYGYMKDAAGKMTWTITEIQPEDLSSTVEIQYVNGKDFIEAYGNGLGDYIVQSIDNKTMKMTDIMNVLDIITDEENSAILQTARAEVKAVDPVFNTATVTIHFQQNGKIYMPTGTSDEVFDVASANLSKSLEEINSIVAIRIIPQIVDRVFRTLQTFDEEGLMEYTGQPLAQMIGMDESNPLYEVLHTYLKTCSSKMTYTVGQYDKATSSIAIDCTFLDSKNIITEYLKNIGAYVLKHIFHPIPSTEENSAMLQTAVDSAKEEYVEKTVTITFNPDDYGQFEVSDEIMDVASANLNSELRKIVNNLK